MKRLKTYDPKCYELAEAFLQDMPHLWSKKRAEDLAIEIQETIESYIGDILERYPPRPL